MEIYHRDHWIIIIHTAKWKDLTRWNEENTIIDWINHMGRIVEHMFPMPPQKRMKNIIGYTLYYLISLYQI